MTQPDTPAPTPPAPTPPAPPAPTPPAQPSGPPAGYLSQDEVNRIAAREKDEGKRAAEKAIADQLGVDLETAKQILKAHRDQEDAAKSDAQKAREAADREKAEAEQAKAAAATEIHAARISRAFVENGLIDPAKIDRYGRLVDVEVGAKYEDIKKAVDKLKTDEPALFGTGAPPPPSQQQRPPAPGSDPKGTPPPPSTSNDKLKAGMERAQQYGKGWGWTVASPDANAS